MKYILSLLSLTILNFYCFSLTWDEPWQEEILQASEYFILGEVLEKTEHKLTVQVINSFDQEIEDQIIINGFFMLDICSSSGGDSPEFFINKGETGYFFLKKNKSGSFSIPTPTSGFDRIVDGVVHSTFRHTYHQAALSPDTYEMIYQVIWNKFRGKEVDSSKVELFINEYLDKEPAGFDEEEVDTFFNQHAALESIYLLGLNYDFETLKKFALSENFHSKVSALRAIQYCMDDHVGDFLLESVQSDKNDDFLKVIAIWSIEHRKDKKEIKRLKELESSLSEDSDGFGGNIMDPRVCTHFPSPREAVESL